VLVAALGFIALFALLFLGIPLAFGLAAVGAVGFAFVVGAEPAMRMLGQVAFDSSMNEAFIVLPLFILMGALFAHSRMAEELYAASYAFLGHRRGGLALSTILACGGFSAVSGSSIACAAAMTKVSVPIMRRYGYAPSFAAATVAAGSTLDILIPPSVTMVIFAIIADVNLGKLMIAGFIPGLIVTLAYLAAIIAMTAANPALGPPGAHTGWAERWRSLREVWTMAIVFGVSIGGIYFGIFTPNEAAGIGAFGAFCVALLRRRLQLRPFIAILADTAKSTATIFVVVIGAFVFMNFITVSGIVPELQGWMRGMELSATQLMIVLVAVYLVLGCVLEAAAMTVLTVPIFFPIVVQAGIDPIWFGIFVVIMVGIGMIHPPLGLLLFVVKRLVPDVSIGQMFLGVLPFVAADIVAIALLIAFPGLVLFLPNLAG
jgi:C4-dicarboxylate transporter DctM subunit